MSRLVAFGEREKIENTDTWYYMVSSVTRKKDGKLMGEAIKALGYRRDSQGFDQRGYDVVCPSGKDKYGIPIRFSHTSNLLKRIFLFSEN